MPRRAGRHRARRRHPPPHRLPARPQSRTCLPRLHPPHRAAFNLELLSAEDYQRLRGVLVVRNERLLAGRKVPAGNLAALMNACFQDKGPAGVRDAAIIALLYAVGGMRRNENCHTAPSVGALTVATC